MARKKRRRESPPPAEASAAPADNRSVVAPPRRQRREGPTEQSAREEPPARVSPAVGVMGDKDQESVHEDVEEIDDDGEDAQSVGQVFDDLHRRAELMCADAHTRSQGETVNSVNATLAKCMIGTAVQVAAAIEAHMTSVTMCATKQRDTINALLNAMEYHFIEHDDTKAVQALTTAAYIDNGCKDLVYKVVTRLKASMKDASKSATKRKGSATSEPPPQDRACLSTAEPADDADWLPHRMTPTVRGTRRTGLQP